jgi:subtilisin family serine protease
LTGLGRGAFAGLLALGMALGASTADAARRPNPAADEYRKSWGLSAIRAEAAYAAGLSGKGVTVALVDCGLATPQRELLKNVSRKSRDVVEDRAQPAIERHGSYVAGPLASPLNGRGMLGVAYNAKILAIRADVDGGYEGQCAFRPSDLARALDYAVAQQARIVVLPLQGKKPLGEPFEAALKRAVDSGAVVVISAGNREGSDPAWPARYAADPRFAGSIIVAGATGYYGEITRWSNRAGATQPWFIAAPGEWILTDCRAKCRLRSGTSYAAPYVAGALALTMEAHPELSGRQTAARVLEAARDAGAPGVDPVYGRGVLDLSRVFAD